MEVRVNEYNATNTRPIQPWVIVLDNHYRSSVAPGYPGRPKELLVPILTKLTSKTLTEPAVEQVARPVDAAGRDLVVESRPREDTLSLAELATAFSDDKGQRKIDWTHLRAFVDRVQLHPEVLSEAIADPPAPTFPLLNVMRFPRKSAHLR